MNRPSPIPVHAPLSPAMLHDAISEWLSRHLADLFGLLPDEIDPTMPFERYGLDSSSAAILSGDLRTWLGVHVDPMIVYNHPSIDEVAAVLAADPAVQAQAAAGAITDAR